MHPYLILDVFTDAPLHGNQLAVFTEGAEVPEELMQRTARELNLSETVFVLPANGDGDADARIRIFTPGAELPFAGHPTLGSAFVVGERHGLDAVRLLTGSGMVPVTLERSGAEIVFGEMEQPIPSVVEFARVEELLAALGVSRTELPVEAYSNGPVHTYVMLGSAEQVAALEPDLRALGRLGEIGVSCFAASGSEFKTRMFGPGLGVNEDPATGSAAGPLALHLARHGVIEFGQQISIRQGEEIGRPSLLRARVLGSRDRVEKVLVGGSAVVVARGEYRLS
jgi:trans-2,3-dihydro-3-hydroxyanthranilate isomerase